mgnify:CR=1 FL=1
MEWSFPTVECNNCICKVDSKLLLLWLLEIMVMLDCTYIKGNHIMPKRDLLPWSWLLVSSSLVLVSGCPFVFAYTTYNTYVTYIFLLLSLLTIHMSQYFSFFTVYYHTLLCKTVSFHLQCNIHTRSLYFKLHFFLGCLHYGYQQYLILNLFTILILPMTQ